MAMILEQGTGNFGHPGDPTVRTSRGSSDGFPLSGPLNERIARVVNERFDQAESYSKGRFERFYRYEKLINMISKKRSYEWKSNAFLPYGLAVAEQSAAIKFLALIGSRPYTTVRARQAGLEEVASHREALLDWRFTGDVELATFLSQMFRISERYGKAIALVAPDWDQRVLKYRTAVNLPTVYGPLARMTWKTTEERAYKMRVEPMDLTDCFPQPGFRRINGRGGMRYFMRRYYLTIDELRELENTDLWGPMVNGEPTSNIRDTQQQEMNEFKARRLYMDKYDDFGRHQDVYDRVVEIIEYQGAVPDDLIDPALAAAEEAVGQNPKERLITLANRKVVGINQALPWDHGLKSFIEMDSMSDPYDFWGKGKIEPIEHLIYIGNEIVNMRIDNVKSAINGLIGVDGSRMPAGWKRRLVSQPWGVTETLGPPGEIIQRLQLGDVTASSYQEQQAVFAMIQEASAINETMMGAPGGAVRTLGEHQMKAQASGTRINMELISSANQLFGATRLNPGLIYMILALDRQYLPLPQYVAVTDPWAPDDFMELQIGPDDLSNEDENFVYTVSGAAEGMSKQARRLEFTQLNQIITPMMQMLLAGGFNVMEYAKSALRTFDHDPDRFFPKDLRMMTPDALGMGGGPMGAAMGMQPGYAAGQPRPKSSTNAPGQKQGSTVVPFQSPNISANIGLGPQPMQRQPGATAQPGGNRMAPIRGPQAGSAGGGFGG